MDSFFELFGDVDGFRHAFETFWNQQHLESGEKKRQRSCSLTLSQIMTILIAFHQSHNRNFKAYYGEQVSKHWHKEFPRLVSYTRFVKYTPSIVIPLTVYLHRRCLSRCGGISFIDSTSLDVRLNQRIHLHKVFAGLAGRKTSTGWFFGFKRRLMVNDQGEILQFCLTPGNVDDHKSVPHLTKKLFGKLFGDKGFIF